ncbi:MAG: MaoC/PaaZ C-terminal domain-containing protein [Rhodocyclaceae bacterium]
MGTVIENRTYDEIALGDSASLARTLTQDDIALFAALSGDVNPAHLDQAYADATPFKGLIAHGMICGALISTLLGTRLPGPGTIYVTQQLQFRRPVRPGDRIEVTLRCVDKIDAKRRIRFECECRNQAGEVVTLGTAEVIAPSERVSRPAMPVPAVTVDGAPYAAQW